MTNLPLAKLAEALTKAQGTMSGAKKDKKNPFFKSSYADLASVFDAIREPFASNDLSVTQTMDVLENGRTVLKTKLLHSSGEYIDSTMMLPNIEDPQKLGSAITYFRRYSLMSIAGIPAEDDDGADAAKAIKSNQPKIISSSQVSILEKLINGHTPVREQVLANCNGDFSTITVDRFPGAIHWIKELVLQEENAK